MRNLLTLALLLAIFGCTNRSHPADNLHNLAADTPELDEQELGPDA